MLEFLSVLSITFVLYKSGERRAQGIHILFIHLFARFIQHIVSKQLTAFCQGNSLLAVFNVRTLETSESVGNYFDYWSIVAM